MTTLNQDFLWGAATAAHQIEGDNYNSDIWAAEHRAGGHIAEPSGSACDSFHRYREDIRLLAEAGLDTYRFSIEWARIEPAEGQFSRAALLHYRDMIEACRERGVTPVVTLHHFTFPQWFTAGGGLVRDDAVERFAGYVTYLSEILHDVEWVVTINEPNILALFGLRSLMAKRAAQAEAAGAQPEAVPTGPDRSESPTVEMAQLPMPPYELAEIITRMHRAAVEVLRARTSAKVGWAFRPDALGINLRRVWQRYGIPLFVTENGIATADDERRIAYTTAALQGLLDAVDDGVDVRGYTHWSLLDNYEWGSWKPTFGLISVDREGDFARTPKPSLAWLGRVAASNAELVRQS